MRPLLLPKLTSLLYHHGSSSPQTSSSIQSTSGWRHLGKTCNLFNRSSEKSGMRLIIKVPVFLLISEDGQRKTKAPVHWQKVAILSHEDLSPPESVSWVKNHPLSSARHSSLKRHSTGAASWPDSAEVLCFPNIFLADGQIPTFDHDEDQGIASRVVGNQSCTLVH